MYNETLFPQSKPSFPLCSHPLDLSEIGSSNMYFENTESLKLLFRK